VFTSKQTNRQTSLKTPTSLRYATPVGNNHACVWWYLCGCRV